MRDTENQKACLAQDVTVYDVSGWGALWRSECRQKELTSKSDPMCFLVVPESGENWVWIFYPQLHSSTYHFGQLSRQHIEGERWHYWIGAAYKELLCLCETCLSALPYFRGKCNPAEGSPSTGSAAGSSVNLELAPYRSLGNTFRHLEPLKVSCWKVLSGVSAPCAVDSHGGRGPALSSSRENKVFYSLRLRLRFKTKVWKQNQMRVMVLLSILNK